MTTVDKVLTELKSIPAGNYYIVPYDYTKLDRKLHGPFFMPKSGWFPWMPADTKYYGYTSKPALIKYSLIPNTNYGTLTTVGVDGCLYLDTNNLLKSDICSKATNNNFYWIISMDGKIYNVGKQRYLRPSNISMSATIDTTALSAQWIISTVLPRGGLTISLWAKMLYGMRDTTTKIQAMDKAIIYPLSPEDAEVWFNEKIGDIGNPAPANNCDVSDRFNCACPSNYNNATCPTGMTWMGANYGGAFANDKVYCLKQYWDEAKREKCATGDLSIIDTSLTGYNQYSTPGYLKLSDCKMLHTTNVCSLQANFDIPASILKPGAWAPWTKETKDTEAVIDFCSQHDTITNSPFYSSNSSYQTTCKKWCDENPTGCVKSKQRYFAKYSKSPGIVSYCNSLSPSERATCLNDVKSNCNRDGDWNSQVCTELCKITDVNCDTGLNTFCNNADLNDVKYMQVCGCFRETPFYDKYFADIKSKVKFPDATPEIPICYFGRCAGSQIKPYVYKQSPPTCPNVSQCLTSVEFTNNGSIKGNVQINQNITGCGDFKPVGTTTPPTPGTTPPTPGTTPPTPGTTPPPSNITCINTYYKNDNGVCVACPSGQVQNVQNNGCVSLDTNSPTTDTKTSFLDKYKWYLIIGIAIMIIIIVIIIIASRKKKSV